MWLTLGIVLHILLESAVLMRAILRPYRDPESRVAWVVVILALPIVGMIGYLLLGETNIGRKRAQKSKDVLAGMPPSLPSSCTAEPLHEAVFPERCEPVFRLGQTINGFAPAGGNSARLMQDSNAGIDAMVADMDAATDHIHVLFYIWLTDTNGLKVAEALKRAAGRGVKCRAMADGLGSRTLIASGVWQDLIRAGVHAEVALPIGNLLLRAVLGRIDLRNHRKIVVIDNRITYTGSQNCADPEFRVKPRYAPWVDILLRFEGPIARQNQYIFIADWMANVDEDIRHILELPLTDPKPGFTAQAIATGPTVRNSAMPETFITVMHAAHRKLFITTPYYVPNESMQAALCTAAWRGVETTIIFPARNDSWQVAAASRSYYRELLKSGVRIYEYAGGLLHTKSMTVDEDICLIGSANMDRRSFELNYENNIVLFDPEVTKAVHERQLEYLSASKRIKMTDVRDWSMARRLWNNVIGMMSPLL